MILQQLWRGAWLLFVFLSFFEGIAATSCPSSVPSSIPTLMPTALSEAPSSQPSLMPICPMSASPSSQPSLTPSIFSSAMPSSNPSFVPSSDPPSVSPTSIPSSIPSVAPSTSTPTLHPTSRNTAIPSFVPSSLPTSQPSVAPSHLPTFSTANVTALPTPFPTATPTDVSRTFIIFYTAQDLVNVNYAEFVNDQMSSLTLRSTVAEFLSYVTPERVYITGAEDRLLQISITPSSEEAVTVYYDTRVPVSSWSYITAEEAYTAATDQLTNSVDSGNFTSAIRRYASILGATSLLEATALISGLRISLDYDVSSPSSPTPSPVRRTSSPTELNAISGSDLSADKWHSPVFVPVLLTGAIIVVFALFVGGSRAWKRWNVYGEGSARYARHLHHEPVMFSLGDEEDMLGNEGGMFSRRRSSLSSNSSDISTKSPQLDEDAFVL